MHIYIYTLNELSWVCIAWKRRSAEGTLSRQWACHLGVSTVGSFSVKTTWCVCPNKSNGLSSFSLSHNHFGNSPDVRTHPNYILDYIFHGISIYLFFFYKILCGFIPTFFLCLTQMTSVQHLCSQGGNPRPCWPWFTGFTVPRGNITLVSSRLAPGLGLAVLWVKQCHRFIPPTIWLWLTVRHGKSPCY